MAAEKSTIRIGYVPEHYLTPLHLAIRSRDATLSPFKLALVPFPSGTGHMITSLRENEIDVAIGLTEAWVAGLAGKQQSQHPKDGGYKVVGHWVDTPLRWAVVSGRNRGDVNDVEDLKGRRVGVSRMGSGSHIMSFVLAQQQGWAADSLTVVPLGPFQALRQGVTGGAANDNVSESHSGSNSTGISSRNQRASTTSSIDSPTAEFFMWEHFTTKPYFHATKENPSPPLKKIGEIFTPWPSWLIVASMTTFPDPENDETLQALFQLLDRGVREFVTNPVLAVQLLGTGELGCTYEENDAMEWLKDVKFTDSTRGVDRKVVEGVVNILKVAGVIDVALPIEDAIQRVIGVKK